MNSFYNIKRMKLAAEASYIFLKLSALDFSVFGNLFLKAPATERIYFNIKDENMEYGEGKVIFEDQNCPWNHFVVL